MYKIVITKIGKEERVESDYRKIADTGNESDGGPIYGYVENKVIRSFETEILSQQVESLELAAVIKAINKI